MGLNKTLNMKKLFFLLCFIGFSGGLWAQQLFIEVYSGIHRTAFDTKIYPEQDWYAPIGLRLAGGAEHIQIGGEYRRDLSAAAFEFNNGSREEISSSYYGGFLRANLGRYPAFGFGVIIKAGVGMYDYQHDFYAQSGSASPDRTLNYDPEFGFNGGIGVSIPIPNALHLEVGYQFNYVQRPEFEPGIPGFKSNFHAIQAGLSWNFVFGDAARRNKHLKENWKWRQGWRG
ncbi:MAG: hypothetical protein D6714_14795 [Bacteroidetes bacterium]|nr:MAG: hypothetical protein D6714_14795 [Bacteroidota bacterium]